MSSLLYNVPPVLIFDLGTEVLCHVFFAAKTEIPEKSNEIKTFIVVELSCW